MSKGKQHEAEASEGARRATAEASASWALVGTGRWSARRKVSVVIEVLKGESLKSLSRRHGVTAAKLSQWRDDFVAGGEARLKHREVAVEGADTRRLKRALLHESSLARTMPTDRILTGRCDTTLVGRGRSSDSGSHSRGRPHSPAQLDSGREDHLR